MPVGKDPAVTVYASTLLDATVTASTESVLGMSAVNVPTTVGVVNAMPMAYLLAGRPPERFQRSIRRFLHRQDLPFRSGV